MKNSLARPVSGTRGHWWPKPVREGEDVRFVVVCGKCGKERGGDTDHCSGCNEKKQTNPRL